MPKNVRAFLSLPPSFLRSSFLSTASIVYFLSLRPKSALARTTQRLESVPWRVISTPVDQSIQYAVATFYRNDSVAVAIDERVHSTITSRAVASRGSLQKREAVSGKVQQTPGHDSRCRPRAPDGTYCSEFPFVRWRASKCSPEGAEESDRATILRRGGTRERLRSSSRWVCCGSATRIILAISQDTTGIKCRSPVILLCKQRYSIESDVATRESKILPRFGLQFLNV